MVDRLSGLPEELISDITHRLGDDKFALRATCRAIEKKSFREFATEHFSKKCVHFTTDSLNVLREISGSARLSGAVKEVSIVTALFSEQGFRCPGSTSTHWKPSVRQSEAYKFYMEDQKTLMTTGGDRAILSECFKNLSGLKTVAFIDNTDCLKDDVDYRGGNKVLRQTGEFPWTRIRFWLSTFTSKPSRNFSCVSKPLTFHLQVRTRSMGLTTPQDSTHHETLWKSNARSANISGTCGELS